MNEFVAYIKTFKINLDEFVSIQQKNHFFNRLKKEIKEKFHIVIKILMTRDAFATLTQRIKSLQLLKTIRKIEFTTIETF